jgi:CheY-like chemotaxis protein
MSLSPDQVESQEQTKQRVLIVEDNPANREAAQRSFAGREGIVIEFASDGKTAQEHLENGKYNIAILDLNMPDETGTGNKEAGIESTYSIIRQFQKKLQEHENPDRRPKDATEYSRDEFNELLHATREIHRAYETHKEDREIAEEVSDYEMGGGVGTYLTEALTDNSRLEILGLSDRTEHFSKIDDKVSNKFGGFSWAIVEAASSLATSNEANQPVGWRINDIAKNKNIKSLILSSEEHSGYGSGVQNMLVVIFERRKGTAFVDTEGSDNPITGDTKFVIGDKRNPEIWKTATSALLPEKK